MTDRILVGNITHLTDARYYAAREVYAIAYSYDQPDPERLAGIQEMIGWVEGPKALLDLRNYQSEPWPDLEGFDGAIISQEPWRADKLFISMSSDYNGPRIISSLEDLSDERCYIKSSALRLPEQSDLLLENVQLGLFFEGEEEEAVGLKDYGDRDDLMDYLQWEI